MTQINNTGIHVLTPSVISGGRAHPLHTRTPPMRSTFLMFALFLAPLARAEEAKAPDPKLGGYDACSGCHDKSGKDAPAFDVDAFAKSVHAGQASCTDCHAGYTMGPHDGELAALSPADQAVVDRIAKARWPGPGGHAEKGEKGGAAAAEIRVAAPRAYLACAGCHEGNNPEAMAGWQASIHSNWKTSAWPPAVRPAFSAARIASTLGLGSPRAGGIPPSRNWIVGKPLGPTSALGIAGLSLSWRSEDSHHRSVLPGLVEI